MVGEVQSAEGLAGEIHARLVVLPRRTTEGMRGVRRDYSRRVAGAEAEFVVGVAMELLRLGDLLGRMVVKALSWAVRELAKKNPREARGFLAAHRGELAARVIREVENKLKTGLKTPRRGKGA